MPLVNPVNSIGTQVSQLNADVHAFLVANSKNPVFKQLIPAFDAIFDTALKLSTSVDTISSVLGSDDLNLDTIKEIIDFAKQAKTELDGILYNGLDSTATNQALTAAQGKILKDSLDALSASLSTNVTNLQSYVDSQISSLNSTLSASIATVASDLASAVSSFNGQISTINGRLSSLEGRATALEGSVAQLQSDLSAEVSNRQSADSAIQAEVDLVEVSVQRIQAYKVFANNYQFTVDDVKAIAKPAVSTVINAILPVVTPNKWSTVQQNEGLGQIVYAGQVGQSFSSVVASYDAGTGVLSQSVVTGSTYTLEAGYGAEFIYDEATETYFVQ